MKRILTIALMALFPAYIALGHDAYLYFNQEPGVQEDFYFADLGWIWTQYSPDSHDQVYEAIESSSPEMWNSMVNPLLSTPAVVLGAMPALWTTIILLILKTFGLGAFRDEGLLEQARDYAASSSKRSAAKSKMKEVKKIKGKANKKIKAKKPGSVTKYSRK